MSGEALNIPFFGLDRQPLDRQRTPGVCEVLRNLRPQGQENAPRWAPTGKPEVLEPDTGATPGRAEGRIACITSAGGDPVTQATGALYITSAIVGGQAFARLFITGPPSGDGSLEIAFTNAGAGNATTTVSYTAADTAATLAGRIASLTGNAEIQASVGQYLLYGLSYYAVEWVAVTPGTGGNAYNVGVSIVGSTVNIPFEVQDFSGGTDPSQFIAIQIGDQVSSPIEISAAQSNNTASGIATALKAAIDSDITGWASTTGTSGAVGFVSEATSNQSDDNGKQVRIIAAGSDEGQALRLNYTSSGLTSGGIDSRDDWGTLVILIPGSEQFVSVETAVIALNETNPSIATKIRTALEADATFNAQYEYDSSPVPGIITYIAKNPGPEYNSPIILMGSAATGFSHQTQAFVGGQNVAAGQDIKAATWQQRIAYGEKTIDSNAGLHRIVALVENKLLIVDPTQNYFATIAHSLPPEPAGHTREATFAQVSETTLICLSLRADGSDTAVPEQTLLLIDDVFIPLQLPPLPQFQVVRKYRWFAIPIDDSHGFDEGFYAVRIAWRFKDGSHSSLSAPIRSPFVGYNSREDETIVAPDLSIKPGGSETLSWRWAFVLHVGIEQAMDDLLSGDYEEIKDYIDGIAVFVSAPKYSKDEEIRREDAIANYINGELQEILNAVGVGDLNYTIPYSLTAPDEQQLYDQLFYDVGTIPREPNKIQRQDLRGVALPPSEIAALPHAMLVDESSTNLLTREVADESVLIGVHHVRAAVAYSYNKRYIMGNTSVVYADPADVIPWRSEGDSRASITIKIVVAIDISGTLYRAVSRPLTITKEQFVLEPVYPSRNASYIEVWADYSGTYKRLPSTRSGSTGRTRADDEPQDQEEAVPQARIKLVASLRNNFAYDPYLLRFDIPATPPEYPDGSDDLLFYSEQNGAEHQPGRTYASDPLNPFKLTAARTYYTETREAVTAFGVNAMPISSGQFGEYPLYIFTQNSISTLEQVNDPAIAFGRISPVSMSIGCAGPQAIANTGRALLFASKYGVYALPSDLTAPISRPINPLITENMEGVSLGYYQQGDTQELWICAPEASNETYCYSLKHQRWFSISGRRRHFIADATGRLYSIGEDYPGVTDGLWQEEASVAAQTPIEIRTGELPFGMPDTPKRIWNIMVRWNADPEQTILNLNRVDTNGTIIPLIPSDTKGPQARPRAGSGLIYTLRIAGTLAPDHWIESFDVRMEARYPHKRV